jgi:hypothetical protein
MGKGFEKTYVPQQVMVYQELYVVYQELGRDQSGF